MMPLHTLVLALSAIIVLLVLWGLIRVFNSKDNDLEWSDLISSERNGKQYADWNKIGQGLGVVLCTWLPAVYAYSDKMDAGGLALVLTITLAYLGGVSSYAATLRARRKNEPDGNSTSGRSPVLSPDNPGGF